MNILPDSQLRVLRQRYRDQFGIRVHVVDLRGALVTGARSDAIRHLPVLRRARLHAIREGVRWGEPYLFFMAPGIAAWVVPLVDELSLRGGLLGGEVIPEEGEPDLPSAVNYLCEMGASRARAQSYVNGRPRWPVARASEAAFALRDMVYAVTGWTPRLLDENRANAVQQRQIAEEIHLRKGVGDAGYGFGDERALLSLMRVGDRAGARGLLNRMLAAIFLRSPNLMVLKARVVEMMGYLVRTAVEDSPMQGQLLNCHQRWIVEVLGASDFEALCAQVRRILDDFINQIFVQGYNRTNEHVRNILQFIYERYTEPIRLEDIAASVNLSRYHVSHLVKEATGRTVTQHIRQHRIREASRMLRDTDKGYADIAYDLGFTDQSYFTRQFRELTGTTPARFRRQYRHA